mmetsp:Transcript_4486/g.16371  ORF Transcript_4486/g.16371 Transcript_4486/m.16371 type:complete len:264 (-) Transcript_4486:121-912(-)
MRCSLGKNVSQADTKGVVTALAISEDGETLVAGLFEGKCIFYHLLMKEMKIEDERGKSIASIKSTKGKNSRGHKITGLQYYGKGKKHDSNAKLLVTTVDSRIRLYRAQDMMLLCKYRGGKVTGEVNKGETSMSTQISATISHDFSLLASGSEDGNLCVWTRYPSPSGRLLGYRKDRNNQPHVLKFCKNASSDKFKFPSAAAFLPVEAVPRGGDRERSRTKFRYLAVGMSTGEVHVVRVEEEVKLSALQQNIVMEGDSPSQLSM